MGYSGLISLSLNSNVIPDLAFFDLILNNSYIITISILVLALALTLSTIDTLINAISSIFIVNGNQINKSISGKSVRNKYKLYNYFYMYHSFYISLKRFQYFVFIFISRFVLLLSSSDNFLRFF